MIDPEGIKTGVDAIKVFIDVGSFAYERQTLASS
jgi:hypothetical protein